MGLFLNRRGAPAVHPNLRVKSFRKAIVRVAIFALRLCGLILGREAIGIANDRALLAPPHVPARRRVG
jgi:hypothetical protein